MTVAATGSTVSTAWLVLGPARRLTTSSTAAAGPTTAALDAIDDAAAGLVGFERKIHLAGFLHAAGDEGEIDLFDFAASELRRQGALRVERPSVDHDAAGVAVDPVDRSELLIGVEMPVTDQGVVDGNRSGSRDTHQPRGFVHDQDFGVLMEDANFRNAAFLPGHGGSVPREGFEGAGVGRGHVA